MQQQQQRCQPFRRHRRCGSISAWSVFAMIACLCCVAVVTNRGMISNLRSETDQSAHASALAAARELLNDDFLRSDVQTFETESAQLRAKQTAIRISRLYNKRSNTPLLTLDQIRIGSTVSNSDTGETPFLQNTTHPNSVLVTISNKPDDTSGRLFLSGVTGVKHGQLLSHATAILQNQVIGFRPLNECSIPLIPLALPEDESGENADCWTYEIELQQGEDRWAWNSAELHAEESADRLPEITITLHANQSSLRPKQGTVVCFGQEDKSANPAIQAVSNGLTSATFSQLQTPLLSFPTTTARVRVTTSELEDIAQALDRILGKPRIFPLTPISEDVSATRCILSRVVAARILRVRRNKRSLDITLQPCVLSTPTAVITPHVAKAPQNRYIWNISAQ